MELPSGAYSDLAPIILGNADREKLHDWKTQPSRAVGAAHCESPGATAFFAVPRARTADYGRGNVFDAFDALTIAYVVPVLIPLWDLDAGAIGKLFAIGYIGQLIGAIYFGWFAEKYGRVRAAKYCIVIMSVMSVACAWSYESLSAFRFFQGLGLGGEVPIAATYINELAKARGRGRYFLLYECIFAVGILAAGLISVWVVPNFGWQWMFLIGAAPALLAVRLQRLLPESPRWLASRNRLEDADRVLTDIEDSVSRGGSRPLPEVVMVAVPEQTETQWSSLFRGIYGMRTAVVWAMWFCTYIISFGLTAWLPTIYRTVYKLPLAKSLQYGLFSSIALVIGTVLCAFLIDRTGRRGWFVMAFIVSAVPLLIVAQTAHDASATDLLLLSAVSAAAIGSMSSALYLYTTEIYPTRMRALGTGMATAWLRIASITGPLLIGWVLPIGGLSSVFTILGATAVVGALVCWMFMLETSDKALEQLSP